MQERILVIDDEEALNELVVRCLESSGFQVLSATCARDGLKMAYETHPDLIILDIMMPEIDGWQTCKWLREVSDVPIIMLTAKVREQDVVRGFQLGADDYVKKPFSLRELEMRVRAVLKRAQTRGWESNVLYDDGTLRINLEQQQVFREGQAVPLTLTEFRLLSYLVSRKARVVPYKELLTEVWGPAYHDATGCLYLYIHYLRGKLEENPREPRYIRTERGVGYCFAPAERPYEGTQGDPTIG